MQRRWKYFSSRLVPPENPTRLDVGSDGENDDLFTFAANTIVSAGRK